jgi:hypothetical protein
MEQQQDDADIRAQKPGGMIGGVPKGSLTHRAASERPHRLHLINLSDALVPYQGVSSHVLGHIIDKHRAKLKFFAAGS